MANYRTSSIDYTPRLTDQEAYDRLPSSLKDALATSAFAWSSSWVLRLWNKGRHSPSQIRTMLRQADADEMKKQWYRGVPNPTRTLKLKPLY